MRLLTALLISLLLTACGGGDPEDQEPEESAAPGVQVGKPACSASHPTCK